MAERQKGIIPRIDRRIFTMKGIFKKTLVCAIAACALTSSVTAFADSVSASYGGLSFIGYTEAETTKYDNNFDFRTYVAYPSNPTSQQLSPVELGIDCEVFNYFTNDSIYTYNTNESKVAVVLDLYSTPLSKVSKARSICTHTVKVNSTSVLNKKTFGVS